MNDLIFIVLAFVAGIALGLLFFGGLWFTIKNAANSKIPALWFFGSLTLRLVIVLTGFYFVGAGNFVRLMVCSSGFIIARFIVIYLTKKFDFRQNKTAKTYVA
jgi:F1F0 ATPase subunit 2